MRGRIFAQADAFNRIVMLLRCDAADDVPTGAHLRELSPDGRQRIAEMPDVGFGEACWTGRGAGVGRTETVTTD